MFSFKSGCDPRIIFEIHQNKLVFLVFPTSDPAIRYEVSALYTTYKNITSPIYLEVTLVGALTANRVKKLENCSVIIGTKQGAWYIVFSNDSVFEENTLIPLTSLTQDNILTAMYILLKTRHLFTEISMLEPTLSAISGNNLLSECSVVKSGEIIIDIPSLCNKAKMKFVKKAGWSIEETIHLESEPLPQNMQLHISSLFPYSASVQQLIQKIGCYFKISIIAMELNYYVLISRTNGGLEGETTESFQMLFIHRMQGENSM